jgi:haloalkane dehalogenase
VEARRTPDERFVELPEFPWDPRYAETADGLRVAYVDEGRSDAPVVLLLHGEPSWSFLYRRMIPPLLEAGFRVVVPDLVGFGRSDKPIEMADYTYARHVEWMRSILLEQLDLRGVTIVGQDWGGLIGLRLVAEHPERFDRVCAANTGLPDGGHRLPEAWWGFRDFVVSVPQLPIGRLVASGVIVPMAPEVLAAYEAPFPDESYKAGARAFPDLIPQTPENPATPDNRRAWAALERFEKPFLCAFSDSDPITAGGDRPFLRRVPGTRGQPHAVIAGAGHFLQEDRGPELASVIIDWAR